MADDGAWHIAPAYDYTFAVDLSAPGYMNRHSMTINNKNSDIERSDLLELAKRYNIKGADAIIEKLSAFSATMNNMQKQLVSVPTGLTR